jgi:hypothetical protein
MLFYSMRIAMDSSELLRLQLSKQIDCARNGVAVGATGPTGPAGESGLPKVFTIFIDYSTPTAISRIYLPPGFSTAPSLASGGIFIADVGSDLVFLGTTSITIMNTKYAFPIGLSGTGYTATQVWTPSASSYLGGTNLRWNNTDDNSLNLLGVTAARLNGGNVATRPTTGVTAGWLATLTIYYL